HAEQNALSQAAKFGISTNGSTIYVTHRPCSICARLIINAGIKKVVFSEGYPDPLTEFMFEKTNVTMTHFTK
ncbi:MAG: cytidine/deoxycytidylate deaminase family protein, partial [Mesotoga sp.]